MPTPAARLSEQDLAEYATLYARRNQLIADLGVASTSISAGGNTQTLTRDTATLTAELRAVTARMRELLGLPPAPPDARRTSDLPDFVH